MTRASSLIALAAVLAGSSAALATTSMVGKTVSVVSLSEAPPLDVPTAPPIAYLSVPVPRRYRGDKDVLLVEADVQAVCTDLASLYTTVDVMGLGAEPDPTQAFATVREGDVDASTAFVTRQWFIAPSRTAQRPPAGAMVRLLFKSDSIPGLSLCTLMSGSMTVRIAR